MAVVKTRVRSENGPANEVVPRFDSIYQQFTEFGLRVRPIYHHNYFLQNNREI
jgi:hypothetical protein